MQKPQTWYDEIQPLFLDEDELRTERILKRVAEQLPQTAESEKIIMKKTKLTKRIRPLIFAAAAIGVGAVSMIAANAATDGAIVKKMTAYINGEPYEIEGRMIQEDDDTVTYEFEISEDDSASERHEFMVEYDGNDFDTLDESEIEGNPAE